MSESKIENGYQFKSKEKEIIKNNFTDYHDWNKGCFDTIKDSMTEHLRAEQNNKCCYCKKELGFDIKEVDIEHILPKSSFSHFTFESKNLALSCPGCNTKKGFKEITNYEYKRYPKSGNNIKIIHAHYDDYFEHIEIINDIVYVAKTKKGSETITICELFRINYVTNLAMKAKSNSGIKKLVEDLRNADGQQLMELKNILRQIIED